MGRVASLEPLSSIVKVYDLCPGRKMHCASRDSHEERDFASVL